MRLVVIALVGCSAKSNAPSPEAIDRCARGAAAMLASMQQVTFTPPGDAAKALACADLYRAPACAQAWRDAFTERPDEPAKHIADACTQAYCAQLSTKPALCTHPFGDPRELRELDTEILTYEGLSPEVARAIAGRTVLFVPIVIPAPPNVPAPPVESLVVTIDATGALSMDRASLASALEKLASRKGQLVIQASPDTPHGKVIELLEAAKGAGVTHVEINGPTE